MTLEELKKLPRDTKILDLRGIGFFIDKEYSDCLSEFKQVTELSVACRGNFYEFLKSMKKLKVFSLNNAKDLYSNLDFSENILLEDVSISIKHANKLIFSNLTKLDTVGIVFESADPTTIDIKGCKKLQTLSIRANISSIDSELLLKLSYVEIKESSIEKFYCESKELSEVLLSDNKNLKTVSLPNADYLAKFKAKNTELSSLEMKYDVKNLDFDIRNTPFSKKGVNTLEHVKASMNLKSDSDIRGWASIIDTGLF